MKHLSVRFLAVFFAVIFAFTLVSCETTPVSVTDPDNQDKVQTKEIVLKASALVLPEDSAFSLQFSDENALLGGIKSALPSCGNAYLNDMISTTVRERIIAFSPEEGAVSAALDVEECKREGNLYSFLFAVYYNVSENAREVVRFWLTADVENGALVKLSDLVKPDYFENGSVDAYVAAYLDEKYANVFSADAADQMLIPAELQDGFYVRQAGVDLVLDVAENEVRVYLSNGAISLFKRSGEVSVEEPENVTPDNYQPAQEGEKVVALTFDDGPGSASTKKLLDYLEANQFKVTFFVNGYNYSNLETDETAKATLRRAVSLGCEIGNHSYSHPYFQNLTPEQRTYQLQHNAELIEAACGVYPNLFRAPGGIFPEGMPEAEQYFYIYWDADGEDWKYKNEGDPQALADRYLQYIGSGSIVLFHDIYQNSVEAAQIVMNTLKAQGYRFVTVSELLNLQDKVPDGTIYTSQNGTRVYMNVEKNG